jgi:hypothetical protein
MTTLVAMGLVRSPTLQALANRLEGSNVFVYVLFDHLMKSQLAGHLTWMGRSGPFRYVRVAINGELTSDVAIATLGHELQHAVEVAEASDVVDQPSLVELYRRIGMPSRSGSEAGWETTAAQAMTTQVRRELIATPTAALARTERHGES